MDYVGIGAPVENIGTVQDGMSTLSKPHTIVDLPDARPLVVRHGEIHFDHVDFSYEAGKPLLNGFNLTIRPGEKVGLIGRSGAGRIHHCEPAAALYETNSGSISIDGQNIPATLPKRACASKSAWSRKRFRRCTAPCATDSHGRRCR